jgi:hypothetical protein
MKTKERTAVNALAWDKLVLLKELSDPENLKGLNIKWVLQKINDPYTVYYSDVPKVALMEYLVTKHCIIRTPFKVVLKVKTKTGKGYMYSRDVTDMNFESEDLEDLIIELVNPMAASLIAQARRQVNLEEVASVSAYVVEDV